MEAGMRLAIFGKLMGGGRRNMIKSLAKYKTDYIPLETPKELKAKLKKQTAKK